LVVNNFLATSSQWKQWKSWYTARILCVYKSVKRTCNISTGM